MSERENPKCKAGLFGIGLDTYWGQFPGLRERLLGYQARIYDAISSDGCEVRDAGLVDSPEKARAAAEFLKREDIDLLFLFVATYALSSTVLPVLQKTKVPLVILNLQPVAAIDYESFNALRDRGTMTGEWLAHCQACSVPEIANVCNLAGIGYDFVTGWLDDPEAQAAIREWAKAARIVRAMRESRVGILGHYYGGMLDVYTDLPRQQAVFGTHFEILEMCEIKSLRDAIGEDDVARKIREFSASFEVSPECSAFEIERAARTSCALDALTRKHRLGALAYYYEGSPGNDYENIVTSVIAGNSLLTAKGIPVAGECEVKNAQAMKIMSLAGAGGSFSEFYAMDFPADLILLGHDGPAHAAIAEGPVALVPLPVYHGKPGEGLSIQMRVKEGPVTLLSVIDRGAGGIAFLVAEGETVSGPTLQIGNTNSRYRFSLGAKAFIEAWSRAGPSHHCAVGTGHIASLLGKVASILGIDCLRIC